MPGLEFSGTVLKLGKAVKPIDDWCPAVGDQVGCGCVQGSAGPAVCFSCTHQRFRLDTRISNR